MTERRQRRLDRLAARTRAIREMLRDAELDLQAAQYDAPLPKKKRRS